MDVQIKLDVMLEAVENHYEEVYLVDYSTDTIVFLKSSQMKVDSWIKGIPMPYRETMDRILDLLAYDEERTFVRSIIYKLRDKDRENQIYRELYVVNTNTPDLSVINTNQVRLIYIDESRRIICSNRISEYSQTKTYINDADENNIRYGISNIISNRAVFALTFRVPSGKKVHASFEIQPRSDIKISDLDALTAFIYKYKKDDTIWSMETITKLRQPQNLTRYPILEKIPLAGEWDNYEVFISAMRISDDEGTLFAMLLKSTDSTALLRRYHKSSSREAIDLICDKLNKMSFPDNSVYQMVLITLDDFRKYGIEEYDKLVVNIFKMLYQQYESCYYINIDDNNGSFLFWEHASEENFSSILRHLRKQLYSRVATESNFTISIGWTSFKYMSERDVINAYDESNRALRAAEKIGGNRILRYEAEMDDDLWIVQMNKYTHTSDVEIRTFGHFDVFVNSKPVIFRSAKAKELLALLIDRRGGFVTTREAVEAMWPGEEFDARTQARYRKVAARLNAALTDNGIERIVKSYRGKRRIDVTMINCDLYKFREDPVAYRGRYSGSYLVGYDWAEGTRHALETMKVKRK